jgi:hypothetical protein
MVGTTGIVINSAALDESSRIGLKLSVWFARLHEPPIADSHDGWCGRGELNALLDPIRCTVTTDTFKNDSPALHRDREISLR